MSSSKQRLGDEPEGRQIVLWRVPKIAFSRIAFFASHGGSGMRGVVSACGSTIQATPALVISNNPDCAAISFAREQHLPTAILNVKVCGSESAVDTRILEALESHGIDLIVLSGYMKIMSAAVIRKYAGRIFNIHPSLLPKYGGRGMWGMHVHRAVIAAGEHETGISIHEVTEHYDEGPVIAQMRVPVLPSDTAELLAERVKGEEPPFLVRTIAAMQ